MENKYNDVIKKLNQDYLDISTSDEYKIGLSISQMIISVRKGKFSEALAVLKSRSVSLKNRKISTERHVTPVKGEHKGGRIAVFTAIFGSYDAVYEPMIVDERCDYYIFTDGNVSKQSVWKKKNYEIDQEFSALMLNRYVKMHPFEFFPEYDYAIYFDGNIEIVSEVSEMIDYINDKTGLAIHNMRNRDCIYDEELTNKNLKKGNQELTHRQIERIKTTGFPRHYGMFECGVIGYANTTICKRLLDEWWTEFENGGGRDQISLPYVLWKNGFKHEDIGFLGDDLHVNPIFRLHDHKK